MRAAIYARMSTDKQSRIRKRMREIAVRYLFILLSIVLLTHCGAGDLGYKIARRCRAQFSEDSVAREECIRRQGDAAREVRSISMKLDPESAEHAALNECMAESTESKNVDWVNGLSCYRDTSTP